MLPIIACGSSTNLYKIRKFETMMGPTTPPTTTDGPKTATLDSDVDIIDQIRASSNDNVELMGIAPAEMFLVEDGQETAEEQQQLEPAAADIQLDGHSDWSDWSFTWRVDGDALAQDTIEPHDSTRDPCSNDHPDFDQDTQPCTKSVGYDTVFAGMFVDDDDGDEGKELNQATIDIHSLEDEDMFTGAPKSEGDRGEIPLRPQFIICSTGQYQEAGKGKAIQVPINFSYDINVKPSSAEKFSSILPSFEAQLSHGVASELDLADCFSGKTSKAVPLQMTRKGPTLRRSLTLVKDSRKLNPNTLVGISAQPKDLEEMIECSASDQVTPSICFPVSGVMTAWIVNGDERLLEESVVEKIHDAVKISMHSYSNEDIVSVNYIGRRDSSLPRTGNSVDTSPRAEEDKSFLVKNVPPAKHNGTTKKTIGRAGYTGIAAVIVALIVAIVGAAQFWRSRRARRRARLEIEQNFDGSDSRSSLDGDMEENAVQASNIVAPGSCSAGSSEHRRGDDSIWSDSDSDYSDRPLSPDEGAFPATTSPSPTKERQQYGDVHQLRRRIQ